MSAHARPPTCTSERDDAASRCVALVTFHTIGGDRAARAVRVADDTRSGSVERPARLRRGCRCTRSCPALSTPCGRIGGDARRFIGAKVRRLLVPMLTVGTLVPPSLPGQHARRELPTDTTGLACTSQPVAHYWFLESLFLIFMLIVLLRAKAMAGQPGVFAPRSGSLRPYCSASTPLAGAPSACRVPSICCRSSCSASAVGASPTKIADCAREERRRCASICLLAAAAWIVSRRPAGAQLDRLPSAWARRRCVLLRHTRLEIRGAGMARHLLVLDLPVPQHLFGGEPDCPDEAGSTLRSSCCWSAASSPDSPCRSSSS